MQKMSVILMVFVLCLGCSCEGKKEGIIYSASPIDLKGIDAKFAKDIAYDTKERTVYDIFLPKSKSKTGLVIFVHGGGFTGGDKDMVYQPQKGGLWDFPEDIRSLLKANIAFASIRYGLLEKNEKEGVIKSLKDVKRALQAIRYRADELNIDKTKIILAGNSAGAGSSLWLAVKDDMKDAKSKDPILRESTRISGAVLLETQASYDLKTWFTSVFKPYGMSYEQAIQNPKLQGRLLQFYGIENIKEMDSEALVHYRKNVNMFLFISADDPEIWMNNTLRDVAPPLSIDLLNHHAFHVKALKEKMDAVKQKNITYYGKNPVLYKDPSKETWVDFAKRVLK